jgi:acyl-CoA thioesterase-2
MLLDALDAKQLGDDRFEARSIEHLRPRVFGGELLAQVLATAARTVQDRACHAIHVDFLFPGDPKILIEYGVRRVRDGRRFVQRQVSGYQRGREIVLATVSFTTDSADAVGFQHERMPEVPGPEGLTSELDQRLVVADRFAPEDRGWLTTPRAVEVRQVRPVPLFDPPPVPPIAHTWIKAIAAMPDDQALHCAVLAYASDATCSTSRVIRTAYRGSARKRSGEPQPRHVLIGRRSTVAALLAARRRAQAAVRSRAAAYHARRHIVAWYRKGLADRAR